MLPRLHFSPGVRFEMIAKVQQKAPDFKAKAVIGQEFQEIRLTDLEGQYVVLFFYPLDFTFVCPTEIIAFNDRIKDFESRNTRVVGVSIDSHFTHLAWKHTARKDGGIGQIDFPLVSDLTKSIARDYGVLIEEAGIALRGLFVIDKAGIIRHITINDLPIGRSVDEVLRVIDALQFVEKYGEVCPANWKPGDSSMKPDPQGSKEYFASVNA